VKTNNQPELHQEFDVMLCWLNDKPARPRARYTIMHTSNEKKAIIKEVIYQIDINSYSRNTENKDLQMNAIARVTLKTTRPLMLDSYRENRYTGSIIL